MAEPFKDIKGNLVGVGDTIACAFRMGNTAELRTGTVVEIGKKKRWDGDVPVFVVDWDTNTDWDASRSKIEVDNGRYLKLTSGKE